MLRRNIHHKRALIVLLCTIVLDLVLGAVYGQCEHIGTFHGVYCATGTATTVGCDTLPVNTTGYLISFAEMFTIVPLFASVFAFFTTGLTADHIDQGGPL